jgi:hypothetical protein
MTSIGDGPIQVTIEPRGNVISDEFLKEMAGRLTLSTWPELRIVETDVSIKNAVDPKQMDNGAQIQPLATIHLHPVVPLPDRWYIVTLEKTDKVELRSLYTHYMTLADARHGCRFRTGSEAAIWGIRYSRKGPDDTVVMVDFSERVSSALMREIHLGQNGKMSSTCEVLEPTAEQSAAMPSFKTISFRCRQLDLAMALDLTFPPGLAGGQTGPLGKLSLGSADFGRRDDGTYAWRPRD